MTAQRGEFLPNGHVKFTVIMVGDSSVGKTSLLETHGSCKPERFDCKATVALEFKKMDLKVNGKQVILYVWDTPGSERFNSLCPQYYRDANGAVLVYDVTKRETFNKLSTWWHNIKSYALENTDIIIVGNKIDLEGREVTRSEGLAIAQQMNCLFMETSAYTGDAITHVLEKLVHKMLPHHVCYPKPDTINLSPNTYDEAVTKERSCFERLC